VAGTAHRGHGSDISLAANDDAQKARQPGLQVRNLGKRLRTFVAYVLLLAVLCAAGICAFALVQGSWQVTPSSRAVCDRDSQSRRSHQPACPRRQPACP